MLGGVTTALYGLIAVLGMRIFVEARVDFRDPANLFPVAVALVVGAADYTLTAGRLSLNGIALGTFAAIVGHLVMKAIGRAHRRQPAVGLRRGSGRGTGTWDRARHPGPRLRTPHYPARAGPA